jgi:hypothetical protein
MTRPCHLRGRQHLTRRNLAGLDEQMVNYNFLPQDLIGDSMVEMRWLPVYQREPPPPSFIEEYIGPAFVGPRPSLSMVFRRRAKDLIAEIMVESKKIVKK